MIRKISVKETGAKGDGITDDTAAFRRALMQEGMVFVPDGVYVITGALPVSPLCAGISSDRGGGIILAKHPEWGANFPRYFRSAITAPSTVSYRLKCAAIQWAIKACAKVGHIPDWLHRWRETILPVSKFRISHLTFVGMRTALCADLDPRLQFYIHGNHFMTDDYFRRAAAKEGKP